MPFLSYQQLGVSHRERNEGVGAGAPSRRLEKYGDLLDQEEGKQGAKRPPGEPAGSPWLSGWEAASLQKRGRGSHKC